MSQMTSAKLKYLLHLTKQYGAASNDPGEIRRIANIDVRSNSKYKKVASTIHSKDISEIIQILKTYTPERIMAYMQRLEAEESADAPSVKMVAESEVSSCCVKSLAFLTDLLLSPPPLSAFPLTDA
jgi:folylpolyglutamate synthase/dihydropteroate synthase